MTLSKYLVSQFVKNTKNNSKNNVKETFVRGTIVQNDNGQYCVELCNKENLETSNGKFESYEPIKIPVKITTNIDIDQPVTVMIKNHTATVIGNASDVKEESTTNGILNDTSSKIKTIENTDILALWSK